MTVDADVTVANGVTWRRSVVFPEPVYFAFKATETPYEQRAVRTCSDWADALPESPDELYLRAASGPAWSEQLARKRARAVLSEQALAVAGRAEVSGATAWTGAGIIAFAKVGRLSLTGCGCGWRASPLRRRTD